MTALSSTPERRLRLVMDLAIEQAQRSEAEGGIPIGSVLSDPDGAIAGRGHNRRVQQHDPILHAEIDCLRAAGRRRDYGRLTIYSTLMPCYMCAGAIVQFGIPTVVAGESRTFPGARDFMEQHGVEVIDLDLEECRRMMLAFIAAHPDLWDEDIGR